jgi:virginiamycin B lyase
MMSRFVPGQRARCGCRLCPVFLLSLLLVGCASASPILQRTSAPHPVTTTVVNEFALPIADNNVPDAPLGITAGPENTIWFTGTDDAGDSATLIGRITAQGQLTTFALPHVTNNDTYGRHGGITAGPDGALWFTEYGKIGRFTTLGQLTTFTLALSDFSDGFIDGPDAITVGPDGALWFTEPIDDRIGRITTQGQVTTFDLRQASAYDPQEITAGPDGALWFFADRAIGRITTQGQVTTFAVSSLSPSGLDSGEITAGPDGALWFAEPSDNQIGRITTQGQITTFDLPPDSAPGAITTGSDGALWFTEKNTNTLGRITIQGHVTLFPLPDQLGAGEITTGKDGALWFTQQGAIGRISP